MLRRTRLRSALILVGIAMFMAAATARAAVFFPTKTTDSADGACDTDCSLREAVVAANAATGPDVILLQDETYSLSLEGADEDLAATGDLDIRDDLTIVGVTAERSEIEGGGVDRVLDVAAGTQLDVQRITVRHGTVLGAGGGIRNGGTLALTACAVTGNTTAAGGDGGGIASDGVLIIERSTIDGNHAAGDGGGIAAGEVAGLTNVTVSGNLALGIGGGLYFLSDTDAVLLHVTITANQAGTRAGGIYGEPGPFIATHAPTLRNSIAAANLAPLDRDCGEAVASAGHNLLGDGTACIDFTPAKQDQEGTAGAPLDPRLFELANYGGPTSTHYPNGPSPVRDAGAACAATDQRGQARDSACDIGAVEVGSSCLAGGRYLCANNNRFQLTAAFTTPQGQGGDAHAVALTEDSGTFWFFKPDNVEITAKVLNGCGVNNRYWVFLSGLTNVATTVVVTDTANGTMKSYTNPQGTVFQPRLDTNAFATCP